MQRYKLSIKCISYVRSILTCCNKCVISDHNVASRLVFTTQLRIVVGRLTTHREEIGYHSHRLIRNKFQN